MGKKKVVLLIMALILVSPMPIAGQVEYDQKTYSMENIKPRKRVLFIGDSVTDGGWGRSGGMMTPSEKRNMKDQNHLFGHGYMEMCAAHFMSLFPQEDYVFMNRGISGNTLYDIQQRWQQDAINLQPDIISILVGINDADRFAHDSLHATPNYIQWEQTYRQLIAQLKATNPQIKIVLGTPFVAKVGRVGDSKLYPKLVMIVSQLSQIIRKIAIDENAILIEYDTLFSQLKDIMPREDYWIWDGIHPPLQVIVVWQTFGLSNARRYLVTVCNMTSDETCQMSIIPRQPNNNWN